MPIQKLILRSKRRIIKSNLKIAFFNHEHILFIGDDMDLKYNLIAHRGYFNLEDNIPENSLKAFKRAIKYNYMIEFDIRKTKDNILVVFHDNTLKRACGINKKIENCTYQELKKLYLFNTTEKIPTLEETLKLISGKVPILIELKGDNKYGVLEELLVKLLDKYEGEYSIQSFNPTNLFWFRLHKPEIQRGLIKSSKRKDNIIKRVLSSNLVAKCTYYAIDVHIKKFKSKKPIIGWTIKNKEEYLEYKNKYYNLICENMNIYMRRQYEYKGTNK